MQDLLYTPTSLPAILGVCAVECDGILKWRDHDGYVYDRRHHLGTIRGLCTALVLIREVFRYPAADDPWQIHQLPASEQMPVRNAVSAVFSKTDEQHLETIVKQWDRKEYIGAVRRLRRWVRYLADLPTTEEREPVLKALGLQPFAYTDAWKKADMPTRSNHPGKRSASPAAAPAAKRRNTEQEVAVVRAIPAPAKPRMVQLTNDQRPRDAIDDLTSQWRREYAISPAFAKDFASIMELFIEPMYRMAMERRKIRRQAAEFELTVDFSKKADKRGPQTPPPPQRRTMAVQTTPVKDCQTAAPTTQAPPAAVYPPAQPARVYPPATPAAPTTTTVQQTAAAPVSQAQYNPYYTTAAPAPQTQTTMHYTAAAQPAPAQPVGYSPTNYRIPTAAEREQQLNQRSFFDESPPPYTAATQAAAAETPATRAQLLQQAQEYHPLLYQPVTAPISPLSTPSHEGEEGSE